MSEKDRCSQENLEYLVQNWEYGSDLIHINNISKEVKKVSRALQDVEDTINQYTLDLDNLAKNTIVISHFVISAKEMGVSNELIIRLLKNEDSLQKVANRYRKNISKDKYNRILKLKDSLEKAQKHPLITHAEYLPLCNFVYYTGQNQGALNVLYNNVKKSIEKKIKDLRPLKLKHTRKLEFLSRLTRLKEYFGNIKYHKLLQEAKEILSGGESVSKPIISNRELANIEAGISREKREDIESANNCLDQRTLIKQRSQQVTHYLFNKYNANARRRSTTRVSFSENAQFRVLTYPDHLDSENQHKRLTDSEIEDQQPIDFEMNLEAFNESIATPDFFAPQGGRSVLKRTRSMHNLATHEERAESVANKKTLRRSNSL